MHPHRKKRGMKDSFPVGYDAQNQRKSWCRYRMTAKDGRERECWESRPNEPWYWPKHMKFKSKENASFLLRAWAFAWRRNRAHAGRDAPCSCLLTGPLARRNQASGHLAVTVRFTALCNFIKNALHQQNCNTGTGRKVHKSRKSYREKNVEKSALLQWWTCNVSKTSWLGKPKKRHCDAHCDKSCI